MIDPDSGTLTLDVETWGYLLLAIDRELAHLWTVIDDSHRNPERYDPSWPDSWRERTDRLELVRDQIQKAMPDVRGPRTVS